MITKTETLVVRENERCVGFEPDRFDFHHSSWSTTTGLLDLTKQISSDRSLLVPINRFLSAFNTPLMHAYIAVLADVVVIISEKVSKSVFSFIRNTASMLMMVLFCRKMKRAKEVIAEREQNL